MPKLWNETIDAHRSAVRGATLDATAALVAENGLLSVTMSGIAERTGIGRATLYKYFPDVDAILVAWHERQVNAHLEQLIKIRDEAKDAQAALQEVLLAYASFPQRNHGSGIAAMLHQGEHVAQAHGRLHRLLHDLLLEGVATGDVRIDVPPEELATYCIHALGAARAARSKAAVQRLVSLTLAGLRRSS